jgi:hypothetical protein
MVVDGGSTAMPCPVSKLFAARHVASALVLPATALHCGGSLLRSTNSRIAKWQGST